MPILTQILLGAICSSVFLMVIFAHLKAAKDEDTYFNCGQLKRSKKVVYIPITQNYPMGYLTFAIACRHCEHRNDRGSVRCIACKEEKKSGFQLDQESLDAVEVVRCGECKKRGTGHCPMEEEYPWTNNRPTDFCSYGERKDGNK